MSVRRTSPAATSAGKGTIASVGCEVVVDFVVEALDAVRARLEARPETETDYAFRLVPFGGRPTGLGIAVEWLARGSDKME